MYAVIEKDTERIIRECNTKEAAIVAAQLEKEKLALADRQNITAVAMDDGGFTDIMFWKESGIVPEWWMNKKEISEIRKRFKPENSNIGHVYGCYVNSSKEVIS